MKPQAMPRRAAFTVIELLVVIGIIALLAGILIPTVRHVQMTAKNTASANIISQLQAAIMAYHQEYGAYPGPLPNNEVYSSLCTLANKPPAAGETPQPALLQDHITMSENLVLGLMGGLVLTPGPAGQWMPAYDRQAIGKGPTGLNPGQPKQGRAYLTSINFLWHAGESLGAAFSDDVGTAADSQIPEFVDAFSSPMPILYMRARAGRAPTTNPPTLASNRVCTNGSNHTPTAYNAAIDPQEGPYDVSQILAYTGSPIGVGKNLDQKFTGDASMPVSAKGTVVTHGLGGVGATVALDRALRPNPADGYANGNYFIPFDALTFIRDPNVGQFTPLTTPANQMTWAPRGKDSYILISAGKDRVYGTLDDITSFGEVAP